MADANGNPNASVDVLFDVVQGPGSVNVAQIQNNQVNVIDPAPRSFGGAGF